MQGKGWGRLKVGDAVEGVVEWELMEWILVPTVEFVRGIASGISMRLEEREESRRVRSEGTGGGGGGSVGVC